MNSQQLALTGLAGLSALLAACAQLPLPPAPLSEGSLTTIGAPDRLPAEPALFADLEIPAATPATGFDGFRANSLREAALGWGAQHGQARRSWEIVKSYAAREEALDTVWNFRRIALPAPMTTGWLLPPIIQRAGAAWSGGEREADAATEYYEILRPARIAGRLPGWRDYLPLPTRPPERPADSLLPLSGEEQQWREWAAEGWQAGLELAESEHAESLARLERDFAGMLEFRRLVSQGMISDMVVEAEHWPSAISGGGNVLRVGNRRLRIVSDAEFIGDTGQWRPQIVAVGPG